MKLHASWSFILMKGVQYVAGGNYGIYIGAPGLYETVRTELKLFQTLAILEVRLQHALCYNTPTC